MESPAMCFGSLHPGHFVSETELDTPKPKKPPVVSPRATPLPSQVRPCSYPPKHVNYYNEHNNNIGGGGEQQQQQRRKAENQTNNSESRGKPTGTPAEAGPLQQMWKAEKQQWAAMEQVWGEQQNNKSGETTAGGEATTSSSSSGSSGSSGSFGGGMTQPQPQRFTYTHEHLRHRKLPPPVSTELPFHQFLSLSMAPVLGPTKVSVCTDRLLQHRDPSTGLYLRKSGTGRTEEDPNPCLEEFEAFRKCFSGKEGGCRVMAHVKNALADCIVTHGGYFFGGEVGEKGEGGQ